MMVDRYNPECVAINLSNGTLLLDTNEVLKIDTYLDEDGDVIDDPFKAVACIVKFPDNTWYGLDLTKFKKATIH